MSLHLQEDGNVLPAFGLFLSRLAEAYPNGRITEALIRSYAKTLGDISLDNLILAGARAVRESKWFPSAAELRTYVEGNADDAALIAWSGLCRAAERIGAYVTVEIEDGHAAQALEIVFGSWSTFCEVEDGPELAMKRQEFLAAYRHVRRTRSATPRRVHGLLGSGEPAGVISLTGDTRAVQSMKALRERST